MATNTAFIHDPPYHAAADTPDQVNIPKPADATPALYRCCAAMTAERAHAHG